MFTIFTAADFALNTPARFEYNSKVREGTVVEIGQHHIKLQHSGEQVTKSYNFNKMNVVN